ncbi:MAG: cytochrome c oxidase cbb3-type subunit 1, partial [Planctomycetota bacterium]
MTSNTPNEPAIEAQLDSQKLVEHKLVKYHIVAALSFMMCSMLTGLLISLQFFNHNPLDGVSEYFSFGRLRLIHTNQIAYGFLVNGFLGMLYYAVPRMTGRPVLNKKLGFVIFGVWQTLIVLVTIGFLLGKAQAVEWGETP